MAGQTEQPERPHRVVGEGGPDDGLCKADAVAHHVQFGTARPLAVRDRDLDHVEPFVERSRAHHRREIQAIRERIDPFEDRLLEDAHAARRVGDVARTDQADQIGEDDVADPTHERHLALCACHARSDDNIGVLCERRITQGGEVFRRVCAVRIEETDPVAGRCGETGLERRAISAVGAVANQTRAIGGSHQLRRPIRGSVVHDNELEILKADRIQAGTGG